MGDPPGWLVRSGHLRPSRTVGGPRLIATAPLAPDRTALLLIDAQQEHFIPGGPHELPGGEDALWEVAGLLERARRVGAHVVHVRHVGEDPVFDDFRPGGPGFDFRPEV